jgi:hypothetical protein
MRSLLFLAAASTAIGLAPAPAAAQDAPGDRVNTVIIYGDDPCPPSSDDEIVVCARMDEGERYRIPEALREDNSPAANSWTNRVKSFEAVGRAGPLSCSTIGLGSELGCTAQMIEAAYAEKRAGPGIRAGELIAAARAERLSTIDAEAAATQARVEMIEREYMARVAREEGTESEAQSQAQATPSAPATSNPPAVPPADDGDD